MDGVRPAVCVVHHHVVVIDRGLVEGMVGLNAHDRLDMAIHALWRLEAIDWVALPVPHQHPCHHTPSREVRLQPLEVRLRLRERRPLVVERIEVDLEISPRLGNVATKNLLVVAATGMRVVTHLLL